MRRRTLSVVALLFSASASMLGNSHQAGFVHSDEYLSHDDARALGFSIKAERLNRSDGTTLNKMTILLPGMITGQMVQAGLAQPREGSLADGTECGSEHQTEGFLDAENESKGWIVEMTVRDTCIENSFIVGVYGLPGSTTFYWISYE
ncbi:MAG: hypothetical protein AB7O54_11535 [Pseudomonadales bacterium]